MATFNLASFINTEYTDEFATERTLIPEGDWRAFIKGVDWQQGNRPNTLNARVSFEFDDEELMQHPAMQGKTAPIKWSTSLFVDLDPETGLILFAGGQNWQLGKIRAAAGQNEPGKPWSPRLLDSVLTPVMIKIEHREGRKEEPKGSGKYVGNGEFFDTMRNIVAA